MITRSITMQKYNHIVAVNESSPKNNQTKLNNSQLHLRRKRHQPASTNRKHSPTSFSHTSPVAPIKPPHFPRYSCYSVTVPDHPLSCVSETRHLAQKECPTGRMFRLVLICREPPSQMYAITPRLVGCSVLSYRLFLTNVAIFFWLGEDSCELMIEHRSLNSFYWIAPNFDVRLFYSVLHF